MADQKSTRTLLLEIAGKVDSSVQKTLKETIAFVDQLAAAEGKSAKERDDMLKKAIQNNVELRDVYKKLGLQVVETAAKTKKVSRGMQTLTRVANTLKKALGWLARSFGDIAKITLGILWARGIVAGFRAIINIGRKAVNIVKEFAQSTIELTANLEETESSFAIMLRSEERAVAFLQIVREEAIKTGASYIELAASAKSFIPYAKGSEETFRKMIQLSALLKAFKPEMAAGAAIALQEAMAGQYRSLAMRFNVSLGMIQQLRAEGLEGLDLVEEAMRRMGVTVDLVEDQATRWRGLWATLKNIGQLFQVELGRGVFGEMTEDLKKVREFLVENRDQLFALARALGTRLVNAYKRLRMAIFGPEGLSEEAIVKAAKWGFDFVAAIAKGIIKAMNLVLTAIRKVISAITGKPLKTITTPTVETARPGRRHGAKPEAAPGVPGVTPPTEQIEQATQAQNNYNRALQRQAQIQGALAAAQATLQAAQTRLNDLQRAMAKWAIETADIPDRYKRGARRAFQLKLLELQKEVEQRQLALSIIQQQASAIEKVVQEQKALVEEMVQADDMMAPFVGDLSDAVTESVELEGIWADLLTTFDLAFDGVLEDAELLVGQFKDIAGSVGDVRARLGEITTWYDELPNWVKNILKGAGIAIAINWVTGGLGGGLLKTLGPLLAKAGIGLVKGIFTLPVAISFIVAVTGATLGSLIAQAFGKASLKEVREMFTFVIDFKMAEGMNLYEAISSVLNDVVEGLRRDHPWLMAILEGKVLGGVTPIAVLPAIGLATAAELGDFDEPMRDAWNALLDVIDADDMRATAAEGIFDPLIEWVQKAYDEIVGKSILPDMMQKIVDLFSALSIDLESPLQGYLDVVTEYSQRAASAFVNSINQMVSSLHNLIQTLNSAMATLSQYNATAGQWTGGIPQGIQQYQTGGFVDKLTLGLLHPGELVLNPQQTRALAGAMAAPSPGFGQGVLTVNTNIAVTGSLSDAEKREIYRMAKRATYEGVTEVVGSAMRRNR